MTGILASSASGSGALVKTTEHNLGQIFLLVDLQTLLL